MNKIILITLLFFILKTNCFSQDTILIADLKLYQKDVKITSVTNKSVSGKVVNETPTILEIQVNPTLIISVNKKDIKSLHLINYETIGREIKTWKVQRPVIKDSVIIIHSKIDTNWNLLSKMVKILSNNNKTITGEVIFENNNLIIVRVSPILEIEVKKEDIIKIETIRIINGEIYLNLIYHKSPKKIIISNSFATQSLGLSNTAFGLEKKQFLFENHDVYINIARYSFTENASVSVGHFLPFYDFLNLGLKFNGSTNANIHYGLTVNSIVNLRSLSGILWFRPILTLGSKNTFINFSPGLFVSSDEHTKGKTISIAGQLQAPNNPILKFWFDSNFIFEEEAYNLSFILGFRYCKKKFHFGAGYLNSILFFGERYHLPYLNVGILF